jgi:hypothetical protein
MDLTTLSLLLAVLTAALGLDSVLHPTSVVLDTSVPPKYERVAIDADTIADILQAEVAAISSSPSVVAAPEIRVGAPKGIAMALAETVKMQSVVIALQYEVGFVPEKLKLAIVGEDNTTKVLISGSGLGGRLRTPPFEEMLTLKAGETVVQLVHRAAVAGLGRIDPYFTSLHLIQKHTEDRDFSDATGLISTTMALFPPTPLNADRALFANLQGIISLFQGNAAVAMQRFREAATADPTNAVAWLNLGFADLQLGHYREAIDDIQHMMASETKPQDALLATAYMTWGAASLGLKDVDRADQMLAKAVEIYPLSSGAFELWGDIKREKGNVVAAENLHRRALENADQFENYAEVVALWFQPAWQHDQPITRSPFSNPSLMQVNK